MRIRFLLGLAISFFLVVGMRNLTAQAPAATPDENPEGNTGALKAQVRTGGSYDAHTGNATRQVNDLHVPGALGIYGLDFTRYWNSVHNEDSNPDAEWPQDFGDSGWSHSWRWCATYGEELPNTEPPGTPLETWVTSITITFPDGHATKFKISRTNGNGGDGRAGPPYSNPGETDWPDLGPHVHDHLAGMAFDGHEFWLSRADGGSVHFVGVTPQTVDGHLWWFYEAREVFDPHGFRTDLIYTNSLLTRVQQEGGNRWLTLTWGNFGGFAVPVIARVETGGFAGSQSVDYKYSRFPDRTGSFLTLYRAYYYNEPAIGQTASATYYYGTAYYGNDPNVGPQSYFPLLKAADDPHYAGAMTKISYNYFGGYCSALPPQPPPPNYHDWFPFSADAIAEERNSETGAVVSRFDPECQTGARKDYNGIGGWRWLFFGRSSGDPEITSGFGYQLTKATDFFRAGTHPQDPISRKQNGSQPTKVWDARGYLTNMAYLDDSGSPSEVHYIDGSRCLFERVDKGPSADPDPGRIHNQRHHWLFKTTDELNNVTVYRRDERRRVTDVYYYNAANILVASERYTYNAWNQVTSHTLPSGAVTYYQYNALQQLELEYNTVDGFNERTEYSYDGLERVERVRDGRAIRDNAPYSTRMEYNGRHEVVKTHYRPTGGNSDPTVTSEYDTYGNRTAVIDELGHRKDYSYDSYRRQTSCTEQLNSPGPNGTNVASRRWDWIYDRVIEYEGGSQGKFGASAHTSKEWRVQIEPEFNAAYDRRATARTFDLNNRMLSEQTGLIQHSGQTLGVLDSGGPDVEVHSFLYDPNGQKSRYTDPRQRVTTYSYDNRNRLESTTEPKRQSQSTNPVTRFEYDAAGNKKKVTFPDTRAQRWENYDPFGQAWQSFDEHDNPVDLTYQWGPMKKLQSVKTYRQRDAPPGGTETQRTDFVFDGMGRLKETHFPDNSTEATTYEFGQIAKYKTRRGQTKVIDLYDARGRELHHYWLNYLEAPDGTTPAVTRLWDEAGRLTNISNVFSTIDYIYDDAGQVITEGNTVAGSGVGGSGARRQLTYWRYPSGEVSQITYPNGTVVAHNYTARGQLAGVGWGAGSTSYDYLPDGRVDYQAWTNNVWTKFEYDGRGLTSSVRHKNTATNHDLAYREYWRDDRDRILAWKRGTDTSLNGMEDGRGDRYAYDEEGQLISASYRALDPAGMATDAKRADVFEYDKMGNRMGTHDLAGRGPTTFTRDDNGLNQYSSWTPAAIRYDDDMGGEWGSPGHANGVATQEGWISASFNALNQPMAMWCPTYGSNFLWFGYDPLGRCVKRWMAPLTGTPPNQHAPPANSTPATFYFYDGQDLVQEGSSAMTAARIYVHGGRVDEVVASQISTGEWRYHHYDARGHCIMLTDTSGVIREQYDYDAFGMPYFYSASGGRLGAAAQWGNRFLFTGREWLQDLRIFDYRARQYQPELGRFLQPDPQEFAAGDYNLYRYCHNDPVNLSDPTGLVSWNAGAGLTSWGNGEWRADGGFNQDLVAGYQRIRNAIAAFVGGSKQSAGRSENGRLRVESAKVDITDKTVGYQNADDARGGYTPNPIGTSRTSFAEAAGTLKLTYHLQIQIRLNLSRGALTRLFAKMREPDHAKDFYAANDRFQAAAGTLVGQRFDTGAAATEGLKAAVDPVIRKVYEESGHWDRTGDHRPRDIRGDNHPLDPDE